MKTFILASGLVCCLTLADVTSAQDQPARLPDLSLNLKIEPVAATRGQTRVPVDLLIRNDGDELFVLDGSAVARLYDRDNKLLARFRKDPFLKPEAGRAQAAPIPPGQSFTLNFEASFGRELTPNTEYRLEAEIRGHSVKKPFIVRPIIGRPRTGR